MSALARWDGFLAQVARRHAEVLAAAEVAARHFVARIAAAGDPAPLSHELMGVNARLQDLESKIIDTWHAQVEDAILGEGLGVPARDRAYATGLATKRTLDTHREELAPRVLAELARQRYAHGDAISGAAIGAHAIAQEAATLEWRAMRAAEWALHDTRPPHALPAVLEVERTQLAYWRTYLAIRARMEPVLARDPALEIRARMESWYLHTAEYEPAWVAAGRPRAPL